MDVEKPHNGRRYTRNVRKNIVDNTKLQTVTGLLEQVTKVCNDVIDRNEDVNRDINITININIFGNDDNVLSSKPHYSHIGIDKSKIDKSKICPSKQYRDSWYVDPDTFSTSKPSESCTRTAEKTVHGKKLTRNEHLPFHGDTSGITSYNAPTTTTHVSYKEDPNIIITAYSGNCASTYTM